MCTKLLFFLMSEKYTWNLMFTNPIKIALVAWKLIFEKVFLASWWHWRHYYSKLCRHTNLWQHCMKKKNGSENDNADSPNYLNDHEGCFKHHWEALLWILCILIASVSSCNSILTYGECSLLRSLPLSMLKCLRLQLERCKLCFRIP